MAAWAGGIAPAAGGGGSGVAGGGALVLGFVRREAEEDEMTTANVKAWSKWRGIGRRGAGHGGEAWPRNSGEQSPLRGGTDPRGNGWAAKLTTTRSFFGGRSRRGGVGVADRWWRHRAELARRR